MLDNCISLILLILCAYKIVTKKYNLKTLFLYGVVCIFALYSALTTGKMIIATSVLIVLAIRGENIQYIAKELYYMKFSIIILHTLGAIILFPTGLSYLGGSFEETRFRITFGLNWPGQFADYTFDLCVLWIFCNLDKLKNKDFCKLILCLAVVFIATDSRVIFAISMLLIMMVWIIKHTNRFNGLLKWIARFIVPVLTIVMFSCINAFANRSTWALVVDKILNTRVRLNGYLYDLYGHTFFGQRCESLIGEFSEKWQSTGSTFDCTYTWLIIEMGIVWLLFLIIIFYILPRKDEPLISILLICWSLGAFIDTDFVSGYCSFIVLLFSLIFLKKDKLKSYIKISNIKL